MSQDVEIAGKVLVVDDNEDNVDLLASFLERRGYETLTASSGAMALIIAKDTPPDLILLDINMPKMSGYEVCERLKADPRTSDIPVIFISALQDTMDKLHGFSVGGVDYITKPFEFKEVLARVKSQVTLYKQRRRIEELSLIKDQLLRTVSHDLKNPLNLVMGYADLLAEEENVLADEQTTVFVERIQQNVQRMMRLITDLLDVNQIEEGLYLSCEYINIVRFLEKMVDDNQVLAAAKSQTLQFISPGELPELYIDPLRIQQVFSNLISNALKYTPENGLITVSIVIEEEYCVIKVADTGYGIPPEAMKRLFEKFYRVNSKEHRQEKGSGLGLAIVRPIVLQHGGHVEIESTPGEGSTFSVYLPLNHPADQSF